MISVPETGISAPAKQSFTLWETPQARPSCCQDTLGLAVPQGKSQNWELLFLSSQIFHQVVFTPDKPSCRDCVPLKVQRGNIVCQILGKEIIPECWSKDISSSRLMWCGPGIQNFNCAKITSYLIGVDNQCVKAAFM